MMGSIISSYNMSLESKVTFPENTLTYAFSNENSEHRINHVIINKWNWEAGLWNNPFLSTQTSSWKVNVTIQHPQNRRHDRYFQHIANMNIIKFIFTKQK